MVHLSTWIQRSYAIIKYVMSYNDITKYLKSLIHSISILPPSKLKSKRAFSSFE